MQSMGRINRFTVFIINIFLLFPDIQVSPSGISFENINIETNAEEDIGENIRLRCTQETFAFKLT